eukprot:1755883-Lingulodinium_polyedra.AAC.1
MAAVQLAVLRADHGAAPGRAPRVKRRWADVRRGLGRPLAREAPPAAVSGRARPAGPPPPGCHELRRDGQQLQCLNCGR